MQDEQNRPHPSSKNLHFQNEARCTAFLVKMSFICMRMKNDFHIKGWAPTLALKQRPGGTRKWPISPYVRESRFRNPGNFFRNPESLALESGRQLDWNPESKFHWQTLEFITVIRNPESSDDCQFPHMGGTVRYLQRFDLIACFIENPVPRGNITKAKGWTQIEKYLY